MENDNPTVKQSDDLLVSFPVVNVMGQDYKLRFTPSAYLRMTRVGIDPRKLTAITASYNEQGKAAELVLEMLAAMLGREENGQWKALKMSAEDLGDQFSMSQLAELSAAVNEALKRALAASTAGTPPAPTPAVQ